MISLLSASLYADRYVLKEVLGSQKTAEEMLRDSEKGCFIDVDKNSKGMITGFSFCNSFFATIKKSRIDNIGSTMMMCSAKDMCSEKKILDFLTNASITIDKERVKIKNRQGEIIFERVDNKR